MTEAELDKMLEERVAEKEAAVPMVQVDKSSTASPLSNVTEATAFTKAIDEAKIRVVEEASTNDANFVKDFEKKLKDATLELAAVEEEKARLEKQNIEYHQELLSTQQALNEHTQAENLWENRQKRREYHYNGVKPIMEFVGIKEPMNLPLLYALTFVLLPFFLLAKLFKGTVGALIAGAEDSDRPKAVKGFLWTLIAVIAVGVVGLITVLVLRWLNII